MHKLVRATVAAGVGLMLAGALTVAPAEARPGPCPASFELTTLAALDNAYPGAGAYAERKDKNSDGLICVKTQTYPPAAPYSEHLAFVDNK